MKHLFFILIFVFSLQHVGNTQAFTVSTYHCLSLYWSPAGGTSSKVVQIRYSLAGQNQWNDGLDMKYNPISGAPNNPATGLRYDKADYRGSLVNLTPGTNYDIEFTLEGTATTETIQASTRSETFPIAQTIVIGNRTNELRVQNSGTAAGYILYDGTNSTIDVASSNHNQCIWLDEVDYIILRGFTLVNGKLYGINVVNSEHIIIENCDISNWGQESPDNIPGEIFGKDYQAGIMSTSNDRARRITIQRNKIHHPKWDANNWSESVGGSNHPKGPQAISFRGCRTGNNVIRYNEIWSDDEHYFNDAMGYGPNNGFDGFPGADSDIYGNYISNAWDDGIESEGGNNNVRIWNNYITDTYIGMANATTRIGPLYIWGNVSNKSNSPVGSQYGRYSSFLKMGTVSNNLSYMTGHMYLFNNTILQPNGEGYGGLGSREGFQRQIRHCVTKNNIFHVRNATTYSISDHAQSTDYDYDYDLTNQSFPSGEEANGINGTPTYLVPTNPFNTSTKTGDFRLTTSSNGFDNGVIIPNFRDSYLGTAPDMGAHENGSGLMVYGVNANFVPGIILPVKILAFSGISKQGKHLLSWTVDYEVNVSHYDILISKDGYRWEKIGKVKSHNEGNKVNEYSFVNSNFNDVNYYKLKGVDFDNSFSYSKSISILGNHSKIEIAPNPVHNTLRILNIKAGEKVSVYNSLGKLVIKKQVINNNSLNVSSLLSGVYYIDFEGGVTLKFVKN